MITTPTLSPDAYYLNRRYKNSLGDEHHSVAKSINQVIQLKN